MPFLFTNPVGLWALLGIPVILLIHFLQRQSTVLPSSTLFLLDAIDRQSLQGRKIDRLRHSIPLWLQLLGVLLLTWLLIEPRWERESAVQRVVLVVDSSASMEAFRKKAMESLASELPALTTALGKVSLTALESHEEGANLYRGDSVGGLLDALAAWQPSRSAHSPEAALQIGRSLAGSEGTLIFLTDHELELPYGARLLSVGEPIENVGFAGQRVEAREDGLVWEVTVINHGKSAQTRDWFLAAGEQRTTPRSLSLNPGEVRTLAGKFPEGPGKIRLILEPDRFTRDDELFLVVPVPKRLLVAQSVEADAEELVFNLTESLDNASLLGAGETGETEPDLIFATYNPLSPTPLPARSVVFLHQKNVPRDFFQGLITGSNHDLMKNLNWQGLIARRTPSIPLTEGDTVLLWQGERPLVVLRMQPDRQQLLFNFDVAQSNAPRLPAFVILIHRFVDLLRAEKIAPFSDNLDLRQSVPLAFATGDDAPGLSLQEATAATTIPLNRAARIFAPARPGFFRIEQGDQLLFEGAANFADTREADFAEAASRSDLAGIPEKVIESQTVIDPWWQLWVIALLLLSLLTWAVLARPDQTLSAISPMES